MSYITPWSEFTLRWSILFNDYQVDMGEVPFLQLVDEKSLVGDESDDAVADGIRPINVPANFKTVVLPILVNEMVLSDQCESQDIKAAGLVPEYQMAGFSILVNGEVTNGTIDFSWGLKGCGFGHFYMSCPGGVPHISNEMMGKGSILEIFKNL